MTYGLGVDLGTTFTAAATAADDGAEMVTLGDHTHAMPSVVLARGDGRFLTGNAAERRAAVEPDRVAREVKRRLGDPMPLILGGQPYPAAQLIAAQLKDVVAAVRERRGRAPDVLTLTHPANWGPYKRELFGQIPGLADLKRVRMLTEPEAAAAHYARNDRLPEGALVAVYDLGGGTFDATVLRTARQGFEILGRPEGIEGIGGIDFDEAVYAHVDRTLDGAVSALDPTDPAATKAAIRLRRECVAAKEALSADTETTIPVVLPSTQTEVRLTRSEFETMVRPALSATIGSLRRALDSASVQPGQLATVLLVGGSSRIPLVAQMVSAELGRPTSVDAHPKHAVVLGAAVQTVAPRRTGPPTGGKAGTQAGTGPKAGMAGAAAGGAAALAGAGKPGGRPGTGPGTGPTRQPADAQGSTTVLRGSGRPTSGQGRPGGPPPPRGGMPPAANGIVGGTPAAGMPAPDLAKPKSETSSRPRTGLLVALVGAIAFALVGGYFGWQSLSHPDTAPVAHTQPAPASATQPSSAGHGGSTSHAAKPTSTEGN